ncbi:MAG: 30S ribosomal protein S1 [bacterium]
MQKTANQKQKVKLETSQFSSTNREAMELLYGETLKKFTVGSIVEGTVLEVRSSEALVDIGYKSEGVVAAEEFADLSKIQPGDKISVLLEEIENDDGMVVLSKQKAEEKLKWENMTSNCQEGSIVEGTIQARVKGGLIVSINGLEAFLPGSQIDVAPIRDMERLVGTKCDFRIVKINLERRNIVVSRRELIEERLREKKKKLLSEISVGQTRKGVVKNITDFGVFVDLDGMDGLLHITDMSWGRIGHPSEMAKPGQEIEIVVLDVNLEKGRVSLGLKQKTPNPWNDIEGKYAIGTRMRGRVVNLAPYGAFVELEEGVEGLVHVSEISWTRRIARASDVLAIGDAVNVVVLNINKDEQKIALGIRQTEQNPWELVRDRYPVGSRIKGQVRNFTSYGAFVELENDIDGMIHVSDMSWTRKINHPSEILKKGEIVEAVVLEVDSENRRISLGLKQAQEDPWATIGARFRVGLLVKGKVTKLTSFGAFVELEEGVEGLIHISQISNDHVAKVSDALAEGQEITARVVRVEAAEHRIGLSIKAASMADEEFERQKDELLTALRPGEDMVNLAGAFDQALGSGGAGEEWHPGDAQKKKDDVSGSENNRK